MNNKFYTYVYLDPRKPGNYIYENYSFSYEPFYVGKGSGNRMYVHLQECQLLKSYNPYKTNKIKSIIANGLQPIIVKTIENVSEQESFNMEILLVSLIKMKKNGGTLTNLCEGGCGSSKSEETRAKIGIAKRQQYANGLQHPMLGKKHSSESLLKISQSHKGVKFSDEHKANLKIVRCKTKNKTQTMSWKVVSPNGEEFIIYGLGEFCRNHNLSQPHMFEVANNRRKHHKGWTCQYYNGVS